MKPEDVGNAPVHDVGGPQNDGPWPAEVEEIARGKAYNRPVVFGDGTRGTAEVVVEEIQQFVKDGEKTDGYAVSYRFSDPTLGGDGQ